MVLCQQPLILYPFWNSNCHCLDKELMTTSHPSLHLFPNPPLHPSSCLIARNGIRSLFPFMVPRKRHQLLRQTLPVHVRLQEMEGKHSCPVVFYLTKVRNSKQITTQSIMIKMPFSGFPFALSFWAKTKKQRSAARRGKPIWKHQVSVLRCFTAFKKKIRSAVSANVLPALC